MGDIFRSEEIDKTGVRPVSSGFNCLDVVDVGYL
jgi:hypothetical protein